jgi:uncharacterized membrane protein
MNIHPVVVHFPIALLTLYSLLEIASLFWRARTKKLNQTKLFLLFVWTIGTFFALQSGELAQEFLGMEWSKLIHTHENFANASYTTYIILSVLYLLFWIQSTNIFLLLPEKIGTQVQNVYKNLQDNTVFSKFQQIILNIINRPYIWYVIVLWATIGLLLLTITWALWGAITQGPDADPLVRFLYDLLIWN